MFDETLHQLDALARSFPLRSESAFERSELLLAKDMRDELISKVSQSARGRSQSSARLIVERALGSNNENEQIRLHEHVSDWANTLLVGEGYGHRLRHGGNDKSCRLSHPEAVLRWRWASLFLPNALLLGAANGPGANGRLILSTPTLGRVLQENPWAELHIHGGATSDFDSWWLERLTSPPSAKKDDGLRHVKVRAAALLRLILHACLKLRVGLKSLLERLPDRDCKAVVGDWLRCIKTGRLPKHGVQMDALFPRVAGAFGYSYDKYEGASWLTPGPLGRQSDRALPDAYLQEVHLVQLFYAELGQNHGCPEETEWVEKLFWQYQRLRVRAFSQIVEVPGIAGLEHFRTKFKEIGAGGSIREGVFERARRVESGGLALGALEVRVSVSGTNGLAKLAQSASRVSKEDKNIELGVIVSLIKPGNLHDDRPTSAGASRFSKSIKKFAKEVHRLSNLLNRVPELLFLIRGVDVASHELSAPTWVVAPFMKELRDKSRRASQQLARADHPRLNCQPVPPMRMTAHAGEDYWSPIEGLRRIDEFIESGVLGEGDRIGHGMALGADLSRYHQAPFLQPREERLFDLIWELQLAEEGRLTIGGSRILTREAEIQRLLEPLEESALVKIFRTLPRRLFKLQAHELKTWADSPRKLSSGLRLLMSDQRTYDILREPVEVLFNADELEVVETLQCVMLKRIAEREILVEANPSSNLLIGDLSSLRNHPMFRMAPIGKSLPKRPRIALAISDDDPLTFNTKLADEISYVYAALRSLPDVSAEDALGWIERARQSAWRGRFTLSPRVGSAQLDRLADALSPRPRQRQNS